ncbi:hypothetical protein [Methanoculleus frigidifontis]|uniref:hypothetical protein n=1 Tax=Methanoculleus frigidifontis TaxID=2584085 RepID=UPI00265A32F2|nr:hypothetical protein [Methanoculleus sp. FWC-SCC1]
MSAIFPGRSADPSAAWNTRWPSGSAVRLLGHGFFPPALYDPCNDRVETLLEQGFALVCVIAAPVGITLG